MQIIKIQKVEMPPENCVTYPDFLICLLLQNDHGKIEPDWKSNEGKQVDWIFTSRISSQKKVIGSCPTYWLRPIFARFGFLTNINPYCGHTLFQVQFPEDEKPISEGLSLFLCNEPTMEIWMKLYLYGGYNK